MALHPCNEFINCPGVDDSPVTNYSSEALEQDTFFRTNFGDLQNPPPLGSDFRATGCVYICATNISQEFADQCAQQQQILCQGENQRRPVGPPPQPPAVFFSNARSCTVKCPDGITFEGPSVGAGFAAYSQQQADAIAQSYACNVASRRRICIGPLTPAETCLGQSYSGEIIASGPLAQFPDSNYWELVMGALPAGLDFNGGFVSGNTVTITGTPTESGTFTFTIQVTLSNGDFQFKTFHLCVIGLTSTPAETATGVLADGIKDTAYNVVLNASVCAKTPLSWQITSGNLPPGLFLNEETGAITGKPTDTSKVTYEFDVTLQTNAT